MHEDGGECIINYQDGDVHKTFDCTDKNEVDLDLGTYKKVSTEVVGISVAMRKLGIQVGFFYPSLRTKRDILPIEFVCPYQMTKDNLSVCTRPATYKFKMLANFDYPGTGKGQFVYECVSGQKDDQRFDLAGAEEKEFEINSNKPDYCVISVGSVNTDSTPGMVKKQHVIHVRFYNNEYIPLAVPTINELPDGFRVCAGEDYSKVYYNRESHGSMSAGECSIVKGTYIDFIGWDSIGRLTWIYKAKAMNSVKSLAPTSMYKSNNGMEFYTQATPWFRQQVKHCGSDMKCITKEKTRLLQHPSVVEAMVKWDASVLY
jgi:hypothetical protein